MKKMEKKLYDLLVKVLGISIEEIHDDLSPEDVASWDSFNGILIATELESTFEVKFTLEEVTSTRDVGDIKKNLRNHGIDI